MGQIEDAFRDAADEMAQIKAQPSNRYWWLYGTIKKKNENGTLDVAIDGVTIQQVKATVSCMMANVGDRVIVLKAGPLMTCVDVIATSDEVKVPASSITGTLPESALQTASTTAKGIMQVGSGLTVVDGTVSVDNGAYVRCPSARRLFTGSVVRTVGAGADSVMVFTDADFKRLFGRSINIFGGDFVGFFNGDALANDVHVDGSSYVSTDKSVYSVLNKTRTNAKDIRINYVVILV